MDRPENTSYQGSGRAEPCLSGSGSSPITEKKVSKVTLHFVWGQPSRKQTVEVLLSILDIALGERRHRPNGRSERAPNGVK